MLILLSDGSARFVSVIANDRAHCEALLASPPTMVHPLTSLTIPLGCYRREDL